MLEEAGDPAMLAGASTCASGVLFVALCLIARTPLIGKSCGTCCAILVFLPSIIFTFFGGMIFNAGAWGLGAAFLCDCPAGFCCIFPAFFAFGSLAALSSSQGSPLIKYELLEAAPDLLGVSVCDPRHWQSSDGGIYFVDGTLLHNGQLGKAFDISVEHCNYHAATKHTAGYWESCRFGVRPVFQCDAADSVFGDCRSDTPCAWAITQDGSPPQAESCGEGRFGLCGVASSLVKLAPTCWGADATIGETPEEACWRGGRELSDGIKAAASEVGLVCGDSPICGLNPPLIELGNPEEIKRELSKWSRVWWWLAFAYLGAPLLCAWLPCAIKSARARESSDEISFTMVE